MRKKITLFAITVLFFAFTFAQTNIDIANAIQVEALPFTDAGVDPTNGTQEENQIGCNFNVPSLDYKFEVVTGGTVTITMATPAGASEPVLYRGTSLNETDVTLLTVYDNAGADGVGCFDNDDGVDGTRTATVAAGDFFYVFCANEGATDIVFTGDAVLASAPGTSSVSDLEALGFNYYPNPVSSDLFLTARENITSVAIFNMLGQEVKSASPSSLETTISMSNLATGTYFVKAQVGDAVGTFKVVKK